MEDKEIKSLLKKESFVKYTYFKKRNILQKDPLIRFCPEPNCENFVKKLGDSKVMYC